MSQNPPSLSLRIYTFGPYPGPNLSDRLTTRIRHLLNVIISDCTLLLLSSRDAEQRFEITMVKLGDELARELKKWGQCYMLYNILPCSFASLILALKFI
jgi:hypothetical protein